MVMGTRGQRQRYELLWYRAKLAEALGHSLKRKNVSNDRRRFLKSGLGMVAARSVIGPLSAASGQALSSDTLSKTTDMTVLFMDDADVLQYCPYPMKREHLANYIGFLAGSGADIISWNVNLAGACWYGTNVSDIQIHNAEVVISGSSG